MQRGESRRGFSLGGGAWLRPVAMAAAVTLAIFGAGGATALASQSALPDSPLYRVKLFTEDVRLWLVFDDTHEAEILMDQSNERMEEIFATVRNGDSIPSNVLSALENRNARAANIITNLEAAGEADASLVGRLFSLSVRQETALLSLWNEVSDSARDEYTEVVVLAHNTRLRNATDFVALLPEDLLGGIIEVSQGEVEITSDGGWRIGGLEVQIDERTIGRRELREGGTATGVFAWSIGGDLRALTLESIVPPAPTIIKGAVQQITEEGIRIAGQWIPFTADTMIKSNLSEGDRVEVELADSADGAVAETVEAVLSSADKDQTTTLTFLGTIESDVTAGGNWDVSGLSFIVPESVSINASAGNAEQGARALVEASYEEDGLTANSITIIAEEANANEIYLFGAFGGSDEGSWKVGGLSLVPPMNSEEPEIGSILSVDARKTGNTLRVEEWVVVRTPDDENIVFVQGTVQALGNETWDMEFAAVTVDESTEVAGTAVAGSRVLIWSSQDGSGMLKASYIRVLDKQPDLQTVLSD
ncbi:MAG: hypothetical protein IH957_10040 [Chloroflexi bacterium]|nr:hypothetical protein [Chloroflexota bacterium]